MTDTSTHVYEDRVLGIPPFRFLVNRVRREPCRQPFALNSHKLVEVIKLLGMLLQPYEPWEVCVPGLLKDRLGAICGVLVFGRR